MNLQTKISMFQASILMEIIWCASSLLPIHTLFKSSLPQFQSTICPRLVVVFTKTALEMLQNLKLTLCAIFFLLIKPFLWCHSRCHNLRVFLKGATSRFAHFQKFSLNFSFKFVTCNPCQSSPSLTILVPTWLISISLVFFYLSKLIFSGFLQFKGSSVRDQNNSIYHNCAPLTPFFTMTHFLAFLYPRDKNSWCWIP